MDSLSSASFTFFVSSASTTRSGLYPAIASALGSYADSDVLGAFAGKSDWSSTATTCEPAPMANSVSVAVGDIDTMRFGIGALAVAFVFDELLHAATTVTATSSAASALPTLVLCSIRSSCRSRLGCSTPGS